jgi:hypothetical protein
MLAKNDVENTEYEMKLSLREPRVSIQCMLLY